MECTSIALFLTPLHPGLPPDHCRHGYTLALPDRVTLIQGPNERAACAPVRAAEFRRGVDSDEER